MNEYIEQIEKLASEKINQVFFNSGSSHAMVVLKNIIKNANDYVETLCGNMCSEVSNNEEYIKIVENFLKSNSKRKFKILFDSYDESLKNKPIFKTLSNYPSQVEIRKLKNRHVSYEGKAIHLTVSDDSSFRLETDIENKIAWGNFNDPAKAKVFHAGFNKFFNDEFSTSILI